MESPHFFKVILDAHILNGKISLPKKFVFEYGESLPRNVELKVRDTIWNMKTKYEDGDLWLRKGWKEFAHHYSLSYGHFLVFKHKGNGLFHVIIFDTSACEIDYKDDTSGTEEFKVPKPKDNARNKKRREASPLPSLRSWKWRKTNSSKATFCESKVRKDKEARSLSFKVVLSRSHINPGKQVAVKAKFVKTHLNGIKQADVVLRNSEGKTWKVQYGMSAKNGRLFSDWKTFVVENELKEGDACVFKLVKSHNILFDVDILRNVANLEPDTVDLIDEIEDKCEKSKTNAKSYSPLTKSNGRGRIRAKRIPCLTATEKHIALQRAANFKSKNPFFMVVIQPSYISLVKSILNVSLDFSEKYLCDNCREIVLKVDGRTWIVSHRIKQYSASFTAGWDIFVCDNKLKVGDVCVFELIKEGTTLSLNVVIFPANRDTSIAHTPLDG